MNVALMYINYGLEARGAGHVSRREIPKQARESRREPWGARNTLLSDKTDMGLRVFPMGEIGRVQGYLAHGKTPTPL